MLFNNCAIHRSLFLFDFVRTRRILFHSGLIKGGFGEKLFALQDVGNAGNSRSGPASSYRWPTIRTTTDWSP